MHSSTSSSQIKTTFTYFVPQTLYKYLSDFDRAGGRFFEKCDWTDARWIFWSVNINNYHWVCAFHKNAEGANVYFMDSLGGVDNLPADLITQLEKLTTSSTIPYHLSPQVIPIDIPPQMGNDCGSSCHNRATSANKHCKF